MKTILLIEDDRFMRDIVSTKLLEHNYVVHTAPNAEVAYTKLAEQSYDAVLLDLELPDEHGFEILKKIKADASSKSIPVLIFSNNDDPEVKEEGLKLGAQAFYPKINTNPSELAEKLVTLFSD